MEFVLREQCTVAGCIFIDLWIGKAETEDAMVKIWQDSYKDYTKIDDKSFDVGTFVVELVEIKSIYPVEYDLLNNLGICEFNKHLDKLNRN